ncbi:hypothetical protein LIER_42385 [Lithospermum erythrorhizon]|uniref:Uncharacterized protein n=1 Tax=Lithospermum erythrorhizon TaxID=34254 RepID=A0AAV3RRY3_LITER
MEYEIFEKLKADLESQPEYLCMPPWATSFVRWTSWIHLHERCRPIRRSLERRGTPLLRRRWLPTILSFMLVWFALYRFASRFWTGRLLCRSGLLEYCCCRCPLLRLGGSPGLSSRRAGTSPPLLVFFVFLSNPRTLGDPFPLTCVLFF